MGIARYTTATVGRNLYETKLIEYDLVVPKCVLFFVVSQFRSVAGMKLADIEQLGITTQSTPPNCGYGQKLYGVFQDGTILLLKEIIDSSD
jgi:hypothetical protein